MVWKDTNEVPYGKSVSADWTLLKTANWNLEENQEESKQKSPNRTTDYLLFILHRTVSQILNPESKCSILKRA